MKKNLHASTATIERLIIGKAIDALLSVGPMKVETGHQYELVTESDEADTIMAAILSSDDGEAWVFFPHSTDNQFVKFVLGNGVDVLGDYHIALEPHLTKAKTLADALEA
jgi:hypothetical protein